MSNQPEPRDDLREVEERARQLGAEAQDLADDGREAAVAGRPELATPLSPRVDIRATDAVRRADRVRAADDVDTAELQMSAAEAQERAAEFLRENAARLERTGEEIRSTEERVASNSERVESVAEDAERLREQTGQVRAAVRSTGPDADDPDRG